MKPSAQPRLLRPTNDLKARPARFSLRHSLCKAVHEHPALWALIVCLLVINSITIALLLRQRAETSHQRAENDALRSELGVQAGNAARPRGERIPESAPDAFAKIPESAIPGRYRFFELGKDRGIVTLNADHTFANEKGDNFPEYTWTLSRDRLVLQYRRVAAHYTHVESPGVYVGLRTDNHAVRLEKIE
jgi:hypothetical protein